MGPLEYRSNRPELSSSSPLANLQDLSSSDPISPSSPSPAFAKRQNAFLSPSNSHPDPFSANAKASPNSHPSFGKNELRRKHMRDSPIRIDRDSPIRIDRDQALAQHFHDSSDDNLSSDPGPFSFAAAGTSRSSMTSNSQAGLGIESSQSLLGEAFQEPLSPTFAIRNRPFKRQVSSSHDPLSGTSGIFTSPRVQPTQQRRRLVGTSPKKLSRVAQEGRFAESSEEEWEQRVPVRTDWQREIQHMFDRGDSALLLDGRDIRQIDPAIADLAKYVHFKASAKTASPDSGPQLNVSHNRIERLPSALFTATNLTQLSLRGNLIRVLPPAIGQLVNLRELNVSSCGLTYLPAEIQKLRLNSFLSFPNPFLSHKNAHIIVRPAYGRRIEQQAPPGSMGPPAVPRFLRTSSFAAAERRASSQEPFVARILDTKPFANSAFPSLQEVCFRALLQPGQPQTLLEQYEVGCLSRLDRSLNVSTVETLEAARRSAAGTWGQYRPGSAREATWCTGVFLKQDGEADDELSSDDEQLRRKPIDVEKVLDRGDDAAQNPWFNRCPCPKHAEHKGTATDWPSNDEGNVYCTPCVQRLEWVSHIAGFKVADDVVVSADKVGQPGSVVKHTGCLPILWRGCGPRCLDFLEEVVVQNS